jgi:hypothetical protein
MAEQSVELLIKLGSGAQDVPAMVRTADPVLIQRASTAPVRHRPGT